MHWKRDSDGSAAAQAGRCAATDVPQRACAEPLHRLSCWSGRASPRSPVFPVIGDQKEVANEEAFRKSRWLWELRRA